MQPRTPLFVAALAAGLLSSVHPAAQERGGAAAPAAATPAGNPAQVNAVLAAARMALGGESRISNVRSFVANGRTRQVRGDNLVPIEFDIQVELPDKYSRRDEFPAQDAGPATTGFNGSALIQ